MTILIFVIVLAILILTHELGHFLAAKFFGIRVDEFGLGFPPRLVAIKKGETEYSLNLIPFGGFVKIEGETVDDSTEPSDRSLVVKPKYIQAIVLVAGVLFNFILAWLLLALVFNLGTLVSAERYGNSKYFESRGNFVIDVEPGWLAEQAGIQVNDRLVSISRGGAVLSEPSHEQLRQFINQQPTTKVSLVIERQKEEMEFVLIPQTNDQSSVIGVITEELGFFKTPLIPSLVWGAVFVYEFSIFILTSLVTLIEKIFVGESIFGLVAGPVGIIGLVGEASALGFTYLLSFMALISINLAIINLIPFPALDGGRILFLAIEKIKGSPIPSAWANGLNTLGFMLLLLLMALVTYGDMTRIFGF
jgi:regulator of sigma E protease